MISRLSQFLFRLLDRVKHRLRDLVRPDNYALVANVMADLTRSKTELILETAFLRFTTGASADWFWNTTRLTTI